MLGTEALYRRAAMVGPGWGGQGGGVAGVFAPRVSFRFPGKKNPAKAGFFHCSDWLQWASATRPECWTRSSSGCG